MARREFMKRRMFDPPDTCADTTPLHTPMHTSIHTSRHTLIHTPIQTCDHGLAGNTYVLFWLLYGSRFAAPFQLFHRET